jgi:hypothetical protein
VTDIKTIDDLIEALEQNIKFHRYESLLATRDSDGEELMNHAAKESAYTVALKLAKELKANMEKQNDRD